MVNDEEKKVNVKIKVYCNKSNNVLESQVSVFESISRLVRYSVPYKNMSSAVV